MLGLGFVQVTLFAAEVLLEQGSGVLRVGLDGRPEAVVVGDFGGRHIAMKMRVVVVPSQSRIVVINDVHECLPVPPCD